MNKNYFAVGLGLIDHLRKEFRPKDKRVYETRSQHEARLLADEELLVAAQINADKWGVKHIDTVASINNINKQITPALYVVNTSNNPNSNGAIDSQDAQRWTLVVVVSNQASQTDTTGLMRDSGELISKVINYVQGYQLDDYHDALERTSTSGTPIYYSTLALYPFTFQTKFQP